MKSNELHYEDRRVIIDAAQLPGGKWEVMKMKHDGTEIESLTTWDEEVAASVYHRMVKEHTMAPLSGKYAALRDDLKKALSVATICAEKVEDGGTCNFDSAAVCLPRWNVKLVEQAAREAGTNCFEWKAFGKKWFVFNPKVSGQAYKREVAAETMTDFLASVGYDAFNYCQAD